MKQRELDKEINTAQRIKSTADTMKHNKMLCHRYDDAKALAAATSAMSRGATPASVARVQETLLTAQSSLEITADMLDEMDRSSMPQGEQTVEDEVAELMGIIDSQHALETSASMPVVPSFPAVPIGSSSPSPKPPPSFDDIEERLARLLSN